MGADMVEIAQSAVQLYQLPNIAIVVTTPPRRPTSTTQSSPYIFRRLLTKSICRHGRTPTTDNGWTPTSTPLRRRKTTTSVRTQRSPRSSNCRSRRTASARRLTHRRRPKTSVGRGRRTAGSTCPRKDGGNDRGKRKRRRANTTPITGSNLNI